MTIDDNGQPKRVKLSPSNWIAIAGILVTVSMTVGAGVLAIGWAYVDGRFSTIETKVGGVEDKVERQGQSDAALVEALAGINTLLESHERDIRENRERWNGAGGWPRSTP